MLKLNICIVGIIVQVFCGCCLFGEAMNRWRLAVACRHEDGYFNCGNGRCIPRNYVRNTRDDCGNQADEIKAKLNCSDDEVRCRVTNRCVHRKFINTIDSCTENQQMILPCRKHEEFTCVESRKCIERWKVMNGDNDCATMLMPHDTSDETASLEFCTQSEFACRSWRGYDICIPREWVRDGFSDCDKGLDETTIPHCDDASEFRCKEDGRCIARYRVMDHFYDCSQGSDEMEAIRCLESEFTCTDTGRCIPISWRKNTIRDCNDGKDELDIPMNDTCLETYFRCPYTYRCIPRSYLCDGIDHCGDCTDEIETCEEPVMFRCPNDWSTTCIHWSYACDPYTDCQFPGDDIISTGPGFKCEKHYLGVADSTRYCVLPQWSLRDSYVSCVDRSDLCFENDTFHCSLCLDGKTIIAPGQICDGVFDCPDLSDECLCVLTDGLITQQLCVNVCYESSNDSCSSCVSGQFFCDGICLPITAICNGSVDCNSSKIDEHYCTKETKSLISVKQNDFVCEILPETFQRFIESAGFLDLANQNFPTAAKRCDGITECRNIEDECSTEANCTNKPQVCDDIPLISQNVPTGFAGLTQDESIEIRRCDGVFNFVFGFSICNGIKECEDGADERNCSGRFYCDAGQVEWLTGKKDQISIEKSKVCDAKYPTDCLDGSDEMGCSPGSHFYCEGGSPLFVRRSQVLNGVRDCADYSDECPPEIFINNALTSRTEMIKNPFFKTMVWIMALLAILGNSRVFVILCKSLWSNRKKAKSARASSVSTVNKLLILNLSIADFLMGISLLIIASKSAQYSGQYCLRDMNWRSSGTCNTVGVLSVISSEASVFTLVCITSYRLYSVYFPIQTRTLSRRVCGWWIVCIWTISFTIALIPLADSLSRTMVKSMVIQPTAYLNKETIKFDQLLEFTKRITVLHKNQSFSETDNLNTWMSLEHYLNMNFQDYAPKRLGYFGYYSASAVCIPRYFKLNTDDTSLSPLSPVVVLFNFIALIYICAAYIAIYQRSSASRESTEQRQNEQRQIAAKKMQRKISILILTDLTCWLPVCLMTFISLGKFGLPDEVYAASAIIFLPINSSLNPLIYTDALNKLYNTTRRIILFGRSLYGQVIVSNSEEQYNTTSV